MSFSKAEKNKIREKINELKEYTPNFRVIHDMKEKIIAEVEEGGDILVILEDTLKNLKRRKTEKG